MDTHLYTPATRVIFDKLSITPFSHLFGTELLVGKPFLIRDFSIRIRVNVYGRNDLALDVLDEQYLGLVLVRILSYPLI